ncbi:hypothetical protein C7999DRAFT_35071 [Corynascus novoguineensis]|uniref:Pyridoxamine 5'-phosphate oxidase Alr4036 family FMN-binding domain-containing protein n=1 Tax=Corynascus novoguineensis TaxID=1126955 RepID=A0AAN7CMU6_9PEZI|nr:hypothetical protein C7999DRAFT_35071 [Corynascus novoguineensis]
MTTANTTAAAPWRAAFLSHLAPLASPTFTLATLHPAARFEAPNPALPCLPRARTCVFRGLWAGLPPNPHNRAPRNPEGIYESDLPVFTTDARSDKASELFDSAAAGDVEASGGTTGGGGPVEAVFWVDSNGDSVVRTQWRVRGHAWVLAAGDADDETSEGARKVREVLRARMRRVGGGGGGGETGEQMDGWSFAREVTAHFGNLSPLMRGSFKAPPPGTPMAYHTEKGEAVGQRLDDLDDGVARKNFRVVVIVPDEVDQVDLSDEQRPRRWLYVYRGAGGTSKLPGGEIIGEWEKVEVWP